MKSLFHAIMSAHTLYVPRVGQGITQFHTSKAHTDRVASPQRGSIENRLGIDISRLYRLNVHDHGWLVLRLWLCWFTGAAATLNCELHSKSDVGDLEIMRSSHTKLPGIRLRGMDCGN